MKNAFIEEKATKKALADFVMDTNKFSMGDRCSDFEKKFAKQQKRKYAILFNSGGSANLAILQTLKNQGLLKSGDRIGFSAVTWSTNVMPIIQMGFVPVPIDCDPRTLNSMSHHAIPHLEKNKCKAFFITNVLGFTGDLDKIKKEADERGIIMLEDNCESLGTNLPQGKAGNFSLASSFSFFIAHHISTIEGGMVCTDDFHTAEMLQIVRANGWDRNLKSERQKHWREKHSVESEFYSRYTFYDLAFNLRPTEITGFLGLTQLPHLNSIVKKRQSTFEKINKHIIKNKDFIPLLHSHLSKKSVFAIPFICKDKATKDRYIKRFEDLGIEIRPLIAGNMQHQPFFKKYFNINDKLSGADFLHHNAFYCGNCPDYTDKEINIIISAIKTNE